MQNFEAENCRQKRYASFKQLDKNGIQQGGIFE